MDRVNSVSLPQVGDSKEPVRKGVRALFKEICSLFPPSKLFTFVMDGLKSKNARQRAGKRERPSRGWGRCKVEWVRELQWSLQ